MFIFLITAWSACFVLPLVLSHGCLFEWKNIKPYRTRVFYHKRLLSATSSWRKPTVGDLITKIYLEICHYY